MMVISAQPCSSGSNVQTKIPFQAVVINRPLSPQSTKFSYLSELRLVVLSLYYGLLQITSFLLFHPYLSNDNEKSRLQAFKARRLEQKQADKEKLAREFPLLFSNTFGRCV